MLAFGSCYLPSKGRDFQAIHNDGSLTDIMVGVVTYLVKVEIFKQFTTIHSVLPFSRWLLLT